MGGAMKVLKYNEGIPRVQRRHSELKEGVPSPKKIFQVRIKCSKYKEDMPSPNEVFQVRPSPKKVFQIRRR